MLTNFLSRFAKKDAPQKEVIIIDHQTNNANENPSTDGKEAAKGTASSDSAATTQAALSGGHDNKGGKNRNAFMSSSSSSSDSDTSSTSSSRSSKSSRSSVSSSSSLSTSSSSSVASSLSSASSTSRGVAEKKKKKNKRRNAKNKKTRKMQNENCHSADKTVGDAVHQELPADSSPSTKGAADTAVPTASTNAQHPNSATPTIDTATFAPKYPMLARDLERFFYGSSFKEVNYAAGFLQDRGITQYPSSVFTLAASFPPIAHSLLALHVKTVKKREAYLEEKNRNNSNNDKNGQSVHFDEAAILDLQSYMHRHIHATNADFDFLSYNAEAFVAAANKGLSHEFLIGNNLSATLGLSSANSPNGMNASSQQSHYYLNSPLGANGGGGGLGGASLHSAAKAAGVGGPMSPLLNLTMFNCLSPSSNSLNNQNNSKNTLNNIMGTHGAGSSSSSNNCNGGGQQFFGSATPLPRDPFWYYQTAFVDLPANVALGRDRPTPPRCTLTPAQFWALQQQIPLNSQRKRWRQVYNSRDHGFNLAVMRRLCQDQIKYGDKPCVLVLSTLTPDHIQSELACALQLASLPAENNKTTDDDDKQQQQQQPRFRPPVVVGAYFSVAPFKDGSIRKYFGQEGTFVFRSVFPKEEEELEAEEARQKESEALRRQEREEFLKCKAAEDAAREEEKRLKKRQKREEKKELGNKENNKERKAEGDDSVVPVNNTSDLETTHTANNEKKKENDGDVANTCSGRRGDDKQNFRESADRRKEVTSGGASAGMSSPTSPAPQNQDFVSRVRGFSFSPSAQLVPPAYSAVTATATATTQQQQEGEDQKTNNQQKEHHKGHHHHHHTEGQDKSNSSSHKNSAATPDPLTKPKLTLNPTPDAIVRDATEQPLSNFDFNLKFFKVPPRDDGPELHMLSQYGSPQSSVFRPMLKLLAERLQVMVDGNEAGAGEGGVGNQVEEPNRSNSSSLAPAPTEAKCERSLSTKMMRPNNTNGNVSVASFRSESGTNGCVSSAAFALTNTASARSRGSSRNYNDNNNNSIVNKDTLTASSRSIGAESNTSHYSCGSTNNNNADYCGDTVMPTSSRSPSRQATTLSATNDTKATKRQKESSSSSKKKKSKKEPLQYLLVDTIITELIELNNEMGIEVPECVTDTLLIGGDPTNNKNNSNNNNNNSDYSTALTSSGEGGAKTTMSFTDVAEALLLTLFPPFKNLATRSNDYFIRYTDQQLFCGGGGEGPSLVVSDDGTKAVSHPQCDTFGSRKTIAAARAEDEMITKRLSVLLKIMSRVKEYEKGDYAKLVELVKKSTEAPPIIGSQERQEENNQKGNDKNELTPALNTSARPPPIIPTTEHEMDALSRIVHFYASQLQQRRSRSVPYYHNDSLFTNKWAEARKALLMPTLIRGFQQQQEEQKLLVENDKLRQVVEATASKGKKGVAESNNNEAKNAAGDSSNTAPNSPQLLTTTLTRDKLPLISSPFVGSNKEFTNSSAAASAGYVFTPKSPSAILAQTLNTNNDASGPFSLANLDAFFSITAAENKTMAEMHFDEQILVECGVSEAQIQTIELWEVTDESF